MILLKVNGLELDLPAGLTLERELETSLFRRNSEAADFVYPVDLPLSDANIVALDNPQLVAKHLHQRSYECEITVDGIYAKAVLYIESVSLAERVVRVSISGDYGGFWKDASKIKVNELELGGIRVVGGINTGATASQFLDPLTPNKVEIFYTPCDTANHINDIINGVITDSDYLFYTAVDEMQNLPGIHEKQEFQDNQRDGKIPDLRSIINPYFYNSSGDKGIIDPVKAYIETSTIVGASGSELVTHDRYFWVPFFRVAFVIKKCFEELGYSVKGTILTDANFILLTLYNTYAINRCMVTESVPSAGNFKIEVVHAAVNIDPRNHVPRMAITEFLMEIAKPCNLQYVINYTTKEVQVNYLGGVIHSMPDTINISNKVNPKPVINYEGFGANNGYYLRFEQDSEDGAIGEKTIDTIDGLNSLGAVGAITGLSGLSPSDLDIAYVQSENAWYQFVNSQWYFYGYHFSEYKSTDNEDLYEVSSKAVSVPMARFNFICRMQFPNATFFTTTAIVHEQDFLLPYSKLGIEGRDLLSIQRFFGLNAGADPKATWEGRFTLVTASVKPETIKLCNYIGVVYPAASSAALTHPCGSSTVYDAKGNLRNGIKLIWNDPINSGLYTSFWKNFTDKILSTVAVDYEMEADAGFYKDFDPQTMFLMIDNVLFLCDKVNYQLPFPSIAKLKLVRYG